MAFQNLKILQEEAVDTGLLKIDAVAEDTNVPIPEATVSISYSGDPTSTIEQLTTDNNGQTEALTLPAPPLEYSMEAERPQP